MFFTVLAIFTFLVTKISFIAFIPLLFKIGLFLTTLINSSIIDYYFVSGDLLKMFTLNPLQFAIIWISFLVVIFSVIFSLYLIYKYYNKQFGATMMVFLLIATGSSIIGGFTPTGTSGARIYIFYYVIIIILSLMMINDLMKIRS